jgi:flagella basal body P-ring formation protein FlgA
MKWLLAVSLAVPAFSCHVVDGEWILGRDLAAEIPAFAALDPSLEIGATPVAAAQRVFHPDELMRLARQHSIQISTLPPTVCFERATEPLTAAKLMPVLQKALGMENAQIEILDFSRYPVPRGPLQFTRAGLSANSLWRGQVMYAEGRSTPVWVKARVTIEARWIEATEMLFSNKLVEPGQLVLRTGRQFPFDVPALDSIELATGLRPIRTIAAGTPLTAAMLVHPPVVERGDKVVVEVTSGGALIRFEAVAESSGHIGETIPIRNPENAHMFRARIEGKGKVSVKS